MLLRVELLKILSDLMSKTWVFIGDNRWTITRTRPAHKLAQTLALKGFTCHRLHSLLPNYAAKIAGLLILGENTCKLLTNPLRDLTLPANPVVPGFTLVPSCV